MNNIFIFGDIFASCDRKFISYFNADSESANAHHNQFISAKSGRVRFVSGSVLYALHAGRNASQRFYIRRVDVQAASVFARCV